MVYVFRTAVMTVAAMVSCLHEPRKIKSSRRPGSCLHEPRKIKSLIRYMEQRKSYTESGKIYFWTATIHKWYNLLENNENKQILVDSLKFLSDKGLITVYAFVIMPNHVHLIWQPNKLNGKESPIGSFLKFTAHTLLIQLKSEKKDSLYLVDIANKKHEIWQRDPLATELISLEVAKQKMNYVHYNPHSGKWNLAKDDVNYYFSSARFYETGIDDFGFLKDLTSVFTGN
jgi:putative transposase